MDSSVLGAILAAGITSVLSLLGLIISKEQKTSEFRQQWIDSLRDEVSVLLGNIEAAIQHIRALQETPSGTVGQNMSRGTLFEKVKPEIAETEKYYHKILLRINPGEHREFLAVLENMRKSFLSGLPSSGELNEIEMQLIEATQTILKKEWRRVKSGELTFRFAKYAAVFLVAASIIGGGLWIWRA